MYEHPAPGYNWSMPPSGRTGDKRRRPRHAGAGLVLICTHVSETRGLTGIRPNLAVELRNLGWGGLQFTSREELRPTCPLSIQIKDPSTGAIFHARGHVRWCDIRVDGDVKTHVVGVMFDEIFTSQATCARFFQGPEPRTARRLVEPGKGVPRSRRRHERYPVDDCFVSVTRDAPLGAVVKPVNRAVQLVDLSLTGAQVICADQIDPGTRVRFILRMGRFSDLLQAGAEVVWIRKSAAPGWWAWATGLHFKQLDPSAQKLLDYMIAWLKSEALRSGRME